MIAGRVILRAEPTPAHPLWSNPRAVPAVRVTIGSGGLSADDYADAAIASLIRIRDTRGLLGVPTRGYPILIEGLGDDASSDSPAIWRNVGDDVTLADLSPSPGPFTAVGREAGREWGEAFASRLYNRTELYGLPRPGSVHFDGRVGLYAARATATGSGGWLAAALADARASTEVIDGVHTLRGFQSAWWRTVTGSPAADNQAGDLLDADGAVTDYVYALIDSVDAYALYDSVVYPLRRLFPMVHLWGARGLVFPTPSGAAVAGRDRSWVDHHGSSQPRTLAGTLSEIDATPLLASAFDTSTASTREAWAARLGVTLAGDDATDARAITLARLRDNLAGLAEDGRRLSSSVWIDEPGETYNLGGASAWNGSGSPYIHTTTAEELRALARRAGLAGCPMLVIREDDGESAAQWDQIETIVSEYLRASDMSDVSIVWPPAVSSKWLLAGHSETAGESIVVSPVDIAPVKKRRRGTSAPDAVAYRIELSTDELNALRAFFTHTTEMGSLPFERPDTVEDRARRFRFTGPPSWSPIAPRAGASASVSKIWIATINLERLPEASVPEEDEADLYIVDGDTGTNTFASDSSITVTLIPGCFLDTNNDDDPDSVDMMPPIGRVYRFFRAVNPTTVGDDVYADSIEWVYEDGGNTSIIIFDEDDGWSYANNTNHIPTPDCDAGTGDVTLRPTSGSETTPGEPLFRHKGIDAITGANESELCPESGEEPVVYALIKEATLLRGSGPAVEDRASGFRHYEAVCAVPVELCTLVGTIGTIPIAHDSAIQVTTRTGCFDDGLSVSPADVKIYEFDECVDDGLGAPLYVQWSYTDGSGTSWVRLHRSTGWSYSIDEDHSPGITCGGTTLKPSTGSETTPGYPYFRHGGADPMSNTIANLICDDMLPGGAPSIGETITDDIDSGGSSGQVVGPYVPDDPGASAWYAKVVGVLQFGSTPAIPARAAGFFDYIILCNTGGIHP